MAYIAEEWAPAEAAAVTSLYVAGTVFGSFCGRFISGLVTGAWGWRAAFLTMGLINLAFLALIAWLLPRSRRFTPSASLLASLSGTGALLRNRSLLATYGIGFALLLVSAYAFSGASVDWRRGLYWGLAAFATFTLAPGLGLPPEVPGTSAAPLLDRQIWWVATAVATGGA